MRSITLSVATVLLIGGLLGKLPAPPALADEPPVLSIPSTGTENEAGRTTDPPDPASPATAPTMPDESAPTAEATDIQERGILPGAVAPGCARVGPEHTFKLGGDEAKGITQFSWTRKEIAARDKLMEPSVQFSEDDPFYHQLPPSFSPTRFGPSAIPLVPGPTTKHDFFLKKETTGPPGLQGAFGSNECVARITYTIIKALMPFDQF